MELMYVVGRLWFPFILFLHVRDLIDFLRYSMLLQYYLLYKYCPRKPL